MRYQFGLLLFPAILGACTTPSPSLPPAGATAGLALLETSDLHANVLGYDYYKLSADPSFGLDRTAVLIAQARAEYPNSLLFDNGDTIQGTALADHQALAAPIGCGETLAVYKAMNQIGYDGGAVGNHEFNYGLAFLNQVSGSRMQVDGVDNTGPRCAGPRFPQVLSNIYSLKTRQPLFAPYHLIDKRITAVGPDGKPVLATIKVGIIGFAPPTIMSWDKRWLEGRVYAEGVVESALKYVPELRAKGAELVVAISHGGLDDQPYTPTMENANLYLAQVPGIDAMLMGHSHQAFPDAASTAAPFNLAGVDKVRGLVHGVPAVMPSMWGKHLGVIGLQLRHDGQRWLVDKARTTVEARSPRRADKSYIAPDPAIAALIAHEHAATIAHVKTPLGETGFRMSTYFGDVGDVSAIEIVNRAQTDYVLKQVKASLPQYAALPVLSMAAPFKSGMAGATDYTDVKAGALALNNTADLYLYPNALHAVKVNGAELKAWLEHAAGRFNTIDPARTAPQELVRPGFASYNFDAVTDSAVRYEIDITQPPGKRIRELRYRDKPVTELDQFLVATNNYRASGGGNFPGLDGSKTVIAAPDANRDILIAYIKQLGKLTRAGQGAQRSWRFAKVKTAGPVLFHAPPHLLDVARQAGLDNLEQVSADDGRGKGLGLYAVDLSR